MKIILSAIVLLLAGCYTEQKAVRSVHKSIINYPDTTQRILRNWKPCVPGATVTDSTAYKQYLDELRAIEEQYAAGSVPDTVIVTDTLEISWNDEAKVKYWQGQAKRLTDTVNKRNAYIKALLKLCKDKPPIHDTIPVKDMADVGAMQAERDKAIRNGKTYKKAARVFAILSGLLALVAFIIFKVKRK